MLSTVVRSSAEASAILAGLRPFLVMAPLAVGLQDQVTMRVDLGCDWLQVLRTNTVLVGARRVNVIKLEPNFNRADQQLPREPMRKRCARLAGLPIGEVPVSGIRHLAGPQPTRFRLGDLLPEQFFRGLSTGQHRSGTQRISVSTEPCVVRSAPATRLNRLVTSENCARHSAQSNSGWWVQSP